jgi:hypothetical protein
MRLPQEFRVSQNIAAAAILLQTLPKPQDPVQRGLHHQIRDLVELAAVQQAKSSSLHLHQAASCPAGGEGHPCPEHFEVQWAPPALQADASGAPPPAPAQAPLPPRPLVRGRIGPIYDAHSIIRSRRQARHDVDVDRAAARADDAQAYTLIPEFLPLRQGGRPCDPDIDLDRSLSTDPPGLRAFTKTIRRAHFPQHFWPPANIVKYTGETNPDVWLEEYRLACQAGGANDDQFVIQYLLICLGENVRAWLEFLPADTIDN